ncbi:MAG: polyprenyl synthetase family protein [Nitrososphaerota archaeon]|nr:polyprenyl synthetase family protein [Nitrososphaerota archaeon]
MANETVSLEFPAWLDEYTSCINDEISSHYGASKTELDKVALEAISKGKRIRAVLALLWCEALGEDYHRATPVAVAYELAHAAALVQDDIIDGSDMRRGEKSIIGKYGTSAAILTSNTLLFQVPNLIAECGRNGSDSFTLCKLLDLLGECYRSATMGEYLDLEMAARDDVSETDYTEMIRLKTGALIGAASASGAIIGSAPKNVEAIDAAFGFGESLGMAYQIQDDLLDLMGEESVIGKPIFTDIRRGKKNLLIIHLLSHSSQEEASFIRSMFDRDGPYEEWEIDKTKKLLDRYDSALYAQEFAAGCIERAVAFLHSAKESNARDRLLELSSYLALRKY